MSYKQNASANRDALFGSAASGGSKKKKTKPASSSTTASKPKATTAPTSSVPTSMGYRYGSDKKAKTMTGPGLSGEARVAKLKEAEEYTKKAKKSMQSGLFTTSWRRDA